MKATPPVVCPRRRAVARVALTVAGALTAGGALAGPPYATDDPEPTDLGHWEIYHFVGGTHVDGSTAGEAGFDFNYGIARDLQLTWVVPMAYDDSTALHTGFGVVETALKWRFLHQQEHGLRPDMAFFPRIYWPTASARFASRHPNLLLPLWAGKDFASWSVFGGGGYQVNPGQGNRDFWLGGLVVTHSLGEHLTFGAEVYHRTSDAAGGKPLTALNAGVDWGLTRHWSLLASLGPGIQNAATEMRYGFYVALEAYY